MCKPAASHQPTRAARNLKPAGHSSDDHGDSDEEILSYGRLYQLEDGDSDEGYDWANPHCGLAHTLGAPCYCYH